MYLIKPYFHDGTPGTPVGFTNAWLKMHFELVPGLIGRLLSRSRKSAKLDDIAKLCQEPDVVYRSDDIILQTSRPGISYNREKKALDVWEAIYFSSRTVLKDEFMAWKPFLDGPSRRIMKEADRIKPELKNIADSCGYKVRRENQIQFFHSLY